MSWRDEIPTKKVKLKKVLDKYAEEHSLKLNPYAEFKVKWMEEHGAHCFCEPSGKRVCPCEFVMMDISSFNGGCLCSVFVTEKKLEKLIKRIEGKKKK